MPPRQVVLDTNFLMLPFQFKIDIFSELEYLIDVSHAFVVSSGSVGELRRLSRKKGKDGMPARLALKMLEANKGRVAVVRSDRPVDDWIVEHAGKSGAIVCTNDSGLRQRLKAMRVKVVSLRGKTKIGFV